MVSNTASTGDDPARAFDFWVGEWVVEVDGSAIATSSIRIAHGGRVVEERYATLVGGFTGGSLSTFDAARGHWRQCWMDGSGTVLDITGGLDAGSMVLTGETADGVAQRIAWSPDPDGTVRQHWTRSTDDGVTWTDVFDGRYLRRDRPRT